MTSALVLVGRVGCRDRRAACGRERPEAMSCRKRFGLVLPRGRTKERRKPDRDGKVSGSGVGLRRRRALAPDRGGPRRGKASWFVKARRVSTERRGEADLAPVQRAALRRDPRAEFARLGRCDKDVRGRVHDPRSRSKTPRRRWRRPEGSRDRRATRNGRCPSPGWKPGHVRGVHRSWPRTPSGAGHPQRLAGVRSIGLARRRRFRPAQSRAGVSRSYGYTFIQVDRRSR